MINYFTPEEKKELSKSKNRKKAPALTEYGPSSLTMQIVFGYASALTVIETKNFGKLKFLMN